MSDTTTNQTRHTGRFYYRFTYAAYDPQERVEWLHREASREVGNLIGEAISDGRIYHVQQKMQEKPHRIYNDLSPERETQVTYSVTIALLNQEDAQVGELVVPANATEMRSGPNLRRQIIALKQWRVVDGEFLERVA